MDLVRYVPPVAQLPGVIAPGSRKRLPVFCERPCAFESWWTSGTCRSPGTSSMKSGATDARGYRGIRGCPMCSHATRVARGSTTGVTCTRRSIRVTPRMLGFAASLHTMNGFPGYRANSSNIASMAFPTSSGRSPSRPAFLCRPSLSSQSALMAVRIRPSGKLTTLTGAPPLEMPPIDYLGRSDTYLAPMPKERWMHVR